MKKKIGEYYEALRVDEETVEVGIGIVSREGGFVSPVERGELETDKQLNRSKGSSSVFACCFLQ